MGGYRVAAAFLAFCLLLIPVSAAGDSGTCGQDARWYYDTQTATLTISGTGAIQNYEQLTAGPDKTLTSTSAAPWREYPIRAIVIEEGITAIGTSAFKKLDTLEEISLPATLERIENYAFSRCGALDRVVIPASVQSIGCNAFLGRYEETKPYIYFLGNRPSAKRAGELNRSFSNNTTLYYISGNLGPGSLGYQTALWNGTDFADPLYPTATAFVDVSQSDWYYNAVDWVTRQGLIESVQRELFGPNLPMSRGMTALLLYRLEGSPADTRTASFSDVPADVASAVSWASSHSIMGGYGNGTFGPGHPLTREQMAVVLYRYSSYKGLPADLQRYSGYKGLSADGRSTFAPYTDAQQISPFALEAMEWAIHSGWISGTSNTTLSPTKTITKAEAAAIFYRFCTQFSTF